LPPLYLIGVVLVWAVDVPFADQWALVPLLDHMYRGGLTIGDLWSQHNEHRLLFPRLLMLGLARISGWNIRYELGANIALAAGIYGVLVAQVRATAREAGMSWRWLMPLLSLAVFSLNQAENGWGGWNIQIFLNVLAAGASLLLLARPARRWRDLALAAGCAVVATYSYSNGLLVWPLGLALLAAHTWPPERRDGLRAAAWLGAGAITLASFFYRYTWTSQAPPPAELFGSPGRYLIYSLTYIGAPPARGAVEYLFGAITGDTRAICNLGDSDLCTYANSAAIVAGALGVGLFAAAAIWLRRRLPRRTLLPYVGLGLYALGTGIFTSLGRASYGNHQALAQRYATTATLFWVALVLLLALCAHTAARRSLARGLPIALIGLFGLLTALGTLQGPDHFRWQYEYLAPARAELLTRSNDELLRRLFFDTHVLRRDVAILQRYHLSVFR
jgi:hypothetical protein